MKKRVLIVLAIIVALLLTTVAVTTASAQGGRCFGDVVNFLACFVDNNNLEILRIEGTEGVPWGVIPGEIYGYAAAFYDEPQYVNRVVAADGYVVELYFVQKNPIANGAYETVWKLAFYNPAGQLLTEYGYMENAMPNPDAVVVFAAAPATIGESSGGAAVTVPAVPFLGDFTPVVLTPGTIENCLVTNTYTVRMREAPTTAAPIMENVPYNTSMPADMITADGQWVRSFFVGEGGVGNLGWIFARYLDLSEACEGLTTVMPIGSGSVTVSASSGSGISGAVVAQEESADEAPAVVIDPTWGGQVDLTVVSPGDVANCLVRTTYTVRMRVGPSTVAPVVDNIPYRTSMPADLMTVDGNWVRANYLGSLGWIHSRYLSLSDACEGLNGINPIQ